MALIVTPNSGQNLNQTLVPIQSNFGTINTAWNVNHVEYGVTGQGKHKLVTMPVNASPTPTLPAEMSLYTQLVSGIPQMFLQPQTGGTPINFTGATVNTGNDTATLPSGIILKWGLATTVGTTATVTFTVPFPHHRLAIFTSSLDLGVQFSVFSWTLSSATIYSSTANKSFYWFAIGN